MNVKELMTNEVFSVSPQDPIVKAARIMQQRNIGCIPVCDKQEQVVGILTDRDIVIRVVAEGRDPNKLDVNKVMSNDITCATPEMDGEEAAGIMAKHQIRRLPVTENGRLVGIIAIGDLASHNIFVDEASQALKHISQPSRPLM